MSLAAVESRVQTSGREAAREQQAWGALANVLDPEVPALSICDLGLVREVQMHDGQLHVVLTPTYSGCPATELIEQQTRAALQAAGFVQVQIELRRAPAWTTDWISEDGRRKLLAYGIAPPGPVATDAEQPLRFHVRRPAANLACPRCGSTHTEQLSAFGSTACKALHRCLDCREPFEHFKPI